MACPVAAPHASPEPSPPVASRDGKDLSALLSDVDRELTEIDALLAADDIDPGELDQNSMSVEERQKHTAAEVHAAGLRNMAARSEAERRRNEAWRREARSEKPKSG